MPRLKVDRKAAFSLSSALVYIASRHIEVTEHRHNAVGDTVGAAYVRSFGPDVMNAKPYSTGRLRNFGALLQGVVYPVDAVLFHSKQEAGRKLRLRCTGVEKCGCSMSKPLFGEQVVGFYSGVQVIHVDADGNPHEHVLWPFYYLAVKAHQVGAFQCFKSEVVVVKVAVINNA